MSLRNSELNIPFHWSVSVIMLTFVTLSIIVGSVVFLIYINKNSNYNNLINIMLIVPFVLTIMLGVLFMPYSLNVNEENVKIVKLSGPLRLRMSDIQHVAALTSNDISGAIRTFGSGGFFGYIGYFKNDKIGNFIMFATEMKNLVIIKTNNKTYVVSCSCRDLLIDKIQKQIQK